MKTFVMKCRVRSIIEEDSGLNVAPSVRWRINVQPDIPEDEYRVRKTHLIVPVDGTALVIHVAERPELRIGDLVDVEVRKAER